MPGGSGRRSRSRATAGEARGALPQAVPARSGPGRTPRRSAKGVPGSVATSDRQSCPGKPPRPREQGGTTSDILSPGMPCDGGDGREDGGHGPSDEMSCRARFVMTQSLYASANNTRSRCAFAKRRGSAHHREGACQLSDVFCNRYRNQQLRCGPPDRRGRWFGQTLLWNRWRASRHCRYPEVRALPERSVLLLPDRSVAGDSPGFAETPARY